MGLADHKDLIGSVAGIVTIGQMLSPVFMVKQIIQQGNTKNVDSMPFVGGLGMCILMLQHGLILKDPAMIPVNIVGLILNVVYLSIYLLYSKDKSSVFTSLAKILIGSAVIVGYANLDSSASMEFNYGIIVTALMFALLGAPLLDLKEIVKNQDTGSMPFPLIASGTVVTFSWLLYGLALGNVFMMAQNIVAFTLCAIQLSLFVIYPSKKTVKKTGKKAD